MTGYFEKQRFRGSGEDSEKNYTSHWILKPQIEIFSRYFLIPDLLDFSFGEHYFQSKTVIDDLCNLGKENFVSWVRNNDVPLQIIFGS